MKFTFWNSLFKIHFFKKNCTPHRKNLLNKNYPLPEKIFKNQLFKKSKFPIGREKYNSILLWLLTVMEHWDMREVWNGQCLYLFPNFPTFIKGLFHFCSKQLPWNNLAMLKKIEMLVEMESCFWKFNDFDMASIHVDTIKKYIAKISKVLFLILIYWKWGIGGAWP